MILPPDPTPWKEKTLIEKMLIIVFTIACVIFVGWFMILAISDVWR